MRYSYVLHFPDDTPPFDRDLESRWRSFLGEFAKPIADTFPDLLFWCSYYYEHAKFRVFRYDRRVHKLISKRIKALHLRFEKTEELPDTLLSDLAASRFIDQTLGGQGGTQTRRRRRRALLTLKFLCATTRLHIDSLVQVGNTYWDYQPTPDQQNPHGNNFESLAHLVGNITRFQFDLVAGSRTAWQATKPPGNTTLALWDTLHLVTAPLAFSASPPATSSPRDTAGNPAHHRPPHHPHQHLP